jgi:DNA-binding transcriptional ArsR family regulator
MTAAAKAEYKVQARIIKALAHPTRLFIVDELSRGERCVCELTEMVGVEMPTVSRHLSQLKNAGILEDEKRGSQVFYRLRIPCVLNFFQCVKAVQSRSNTK